MDSFFASQLDYISFIYCLSLLLMAMACLQMCGQGQRLPWSWLGVFGLLQGVHEFLGLLAQDLGDGIAFQSARAGLALVSYAFLVEFARAGTGLSRGKGPGRWIFLPLILSALAGASLGVGGFNASSWLALGFIGSVWSAWVFFVSARDSHGTERKALFLAGASFLVYALAGTAGLPQSGLFPATVINSAGFLGALGFPVALALAALVFLLVISLLSLQPSAGGEHARRGITFAPLAMVLAVIVLGWFLTQAVGKFGEKGARRNLISRTLTATSSIDPGRVATLTGTPEDKGRPGFERIRRQLMAIRAANPDCRFVYLMGMKDEKLIFMADAEPEDSEDYSAPGDVYEDAKPRDYEDYRAAKTVVYEPYTDSWGTWVSGQSPVLDWKTGRMLAQLGMDVDARDWIRAINHYRLFVIIVSLFISVLGLASYIAWQRTRESAAQAAALAERKGLEQQRADFNAMVTQDLKAPLSAIFGYTDMLLTDMKSELTKETEEVASAIQENCRKLVGMVDDFMTVSRLEYGNMDLDLRPADVRGLLDEAIEVFRPQAREKGVELGKIIPPGLRQAVIDRLHVQRAVGNLLQNAINATPKGGSVTLRAEQGGGQGAESLFISVADTGPGIPERERARIFEKYYRSSRTGGLKGGGLGLAIVKAVASAHKGRVDLRTEEGRGSTFTLVLPSGGA